MKMIAATNNEHKLKELKKILDNLGIEIISLKEAGIDIEIEENGDSFEANALIKAREIYKITGKPTIADDSGLEVEALKGKPGIYSARYAGVEGLEKDKKNRERLLEDMKDIQMEDRKARFCSAIAAVFSENKEIVAKGYLYGSIGFEEKGNNGFGYDSLFIVEESGGRTLAEISEEDKNNISHRANALKEYMRLLENDMK